MERGLSPRSNYCQNHYKSQKTKASVAATKPKPFTNELSGSQPGPAEGEPGGQAQQAFLSRRRRGSPPDPAATGLLAGSSALARPLVVAGSIGGPALRCWPSPFQPESRPSWLCPAPYALVFQIPSASSLECGPPSWVL